MVALEQREFNLALVGTWWNTQEPTRGQTNYGLMLNGMNEARRGNMRVLVHPLIWASGKDSLPGWLKSGSFSRDETISIMRRRIQGVAAALVGSTVDSVIVVNEAYLPTDVMARLVGRDYVAIAFEMAREYFPNAKLVYNAADNHTTAGSQTRVTREIVTDLSSRGLLDKLGLECIISATHAPKSADVMETARSYGVPVVVTEFGVILTGLNGDQRSRWSMQASIYQDMLGAMIESRVCREFVIFQAADKFSIWQVDPRFGASPTAQPNPFDDNLQPKPAYFAVLQLLRAAAEGK
ncbi:MAG: endo-1,4-beta-xylanase [Dehalococcoidia bacterium]|nr:endo-1,4-beta-xylanase [Dehalococcoidia bacterium]